MTANSEGAVKRQVRKGGGVDGALRWIGVPLRMFGSLSPSTARLWRFAPSERAVPIFPNRGSV